ncbi:hypothetical protein dsx2_2036 [Desulfovibrio sp. X2]|uniref:hypothetical protein n=1 Tax=Desulfovibrio sp. X2 TaxID=941449 RepID=UPI000358E563|nr:hypothetical protein [Desulfovibrio sp. X2]EPR43926.1 hypothetical protein dsx2_2036 [Desulfovibrio sp. X2]
MLALKAALFWVLMLTLAVSNGMVRQVLTARFLGADAARQVHSVLLAVLLFFLARAFVRRSGPSDLGGRLALGLCWAVATVATEIVLGRMLGMPWDQLMADWNILSGRLWPLVPLALVLGPLFGGAGLAPARPARGRRSGAKSGAKSGSARGRGGKGGGGKGGGRRSGAKARGGEE